MRVRKHLLMSMAVALSMVYLDRCPAGGQTPAKPAGTQAEPQSDPDGVVGVDLGQGTPLSNKDRAWSILTNAMNDHKHAEIRIQALAALGSMGGDPRAIQMILDTFNDPDVDLRTAAVLAAGQTKSPLVTTDLRRMLDDKEPPVAFAAATALWKMNDRSGEDILVAVVDGERPAGDGLVSGTMHTMSRDLHNPGEMARLGAMQGASMLLGPFGMGITALEYMRKNGGDAARVSAVEEIAENHTAPIRGKLIAALGDKDVGVRTAAAKALGSYHEPDVAPALVNDFEDAKAPVRLTSAASFLLSTGAVAAAPSAKQEHAKARARARRRS